MNTKLKDGLSIVIPVFNESENIEPLISKILDFKRIIDFKYEIILVDGCSTDGTQDLLLKLIDRNYLNKNVKLLSMESKQGYGHDIMEGLRVAQFSSLAWTHADLQTDLNDLIEGFAILKNNKSTTVVKGKRIGRNFIDSSLTLAMQIYTFLKIGINISDINAQPKIFSRAFYNILINELAPNDFSLDLFFLINAKKEDYEIKTFKVKFEDRKFGNAKGGGGSLGNRIALIKRTIKYINNSKKLYS